MATVARAHGIPRSTLASHVTSRSKSTKRELAPILAQQEKHTLETYMVQMANHRLPLTMEQLKLKMALLTQKRATPFLNGIPRHGWPRWFQKCHPTLTTVNKAITKLRSF